MTAPTTGFGPAPDQGENPRENPRAFLEHLYRVAVDRALPLSTLGAHLPQPPDPKKGRTLVLGAGKAGGSMVQALEALWPADAPLSGLVVTRYDHIPPRPEGVPERIELVEAAHPVPDEAGQQAAERMLALTQGLTADDLVLCLISGGGSSLLVLPAEGLTLADKQRINKQLLDSGAGIGEMNCVRKHLSRIKGGRLAAACAPARVVTLTISDVPGDDAAVIASGPTVPDATTCADALAILDRYGIEVPAPVRARLESGELETPKPGDAVFEGHQTHMIATPRQSLEAAAKAAREAGVEAHILSDEIEGESREVGQGARCIGTRRGAPRRTLRAALRDSFGRRDHGHHPRAPARPGQGPGRAGRRVLHGACRRAHGPAAGLGAGRRHRRHRRRGRQRGRLRHPRHAGARHRGRPQAVRSPRPQRRLRLFRCHRRPVRHRPDPHQRQRLPSAAGALRPQERPGRQGSPLATRFVNSG
jgi:glycerate 2-kinase